MRSSESLSSRHAAPLRTELRPRAGSARTFRSAERERLRVARARRARPSGPCSTSSPTPAGLGRDHGDARGHRLDDGERAALVVAREQRALGLGEERGHVLPVAEEPDRAGEPELRASCSASARSGPSPTTCSSASGISARTAASARNARSGRFGGASRPTIRILPRTGARGSAKRSSATPFGITRYCSGRPTPGREARLALVCRRARRSRRTSARRGARARR